MYSPFYFYFNLCYDAYLSESKPVESIKSRLKEFEQIQEKQSVSYRNSDGFPWIDITLLKANSYNNWVQDDSAKQCNLIAVVGSKHLHHPAETTETRYWQYVDLLKKIADLLNWELIDEETEDGIEDYVVYNPRIPK
jgi:hypothetical protein